MTSDIYHVYYPEYLDKSAKSFSSSVSIVTIGHHNEMILVPRRATEYSKFSPGQFMNISDGGMLRW